jgi:hypothetical protein
LKGGTLFKTLHKSKDVDFQVWLFPTLENFQVWEKATLENFQVWEKATLERGNFV